MTRQDVETLYENYANRAKHIDVMIDQTWEKISNIVQERNLDLIQVHIKEIVKYKMQKRYILELIIDIEKIIKTDEGRSEGRIK